MSDSKRIHFIGIAGSGMSGLAILAKSQGHQVSGSDRQRSKYLDAVEANGIAVSFDQGPANITPDIDIVVASTAIRAENPELKAAVDLGLDVWPRAKMLAWLGRDLQTWAVAGTHGKTTTSSMLASALNNMGADPSFVIGGVLTEFQSSARLGTGQDYVVEADESDESFTMLSPSVAIVTNIEMDHLDHFHSLDEIDEAFSRFIDTLGEDGLLVYCIDDPELAEIARQSDKRKASYGFSASAKYRCQSLDAQNFVVHFPDGQASVTLPYSPGAHNVLNATASLAALVEMGYAAGPSAKAVSGFKGVGRRFELVGEGRGVQVFDDYGHHPTEIKATLSAAQALGFNHTHVLFQPHRYSRTHELFDSFVEAFDDADTLTLLDIYSAGEDPVAGISSQALVEAINTAHPGRDVRLLDREDAPGYLASLAKPGDLIITIGAGDVTLLAPLIVEALGEPPDDGEPPDEGGSLDDGEPPDDGGSLPTD
ncbi:MAG: UDP-N-acetylmuramate--L-alanine ligase, partial [Coriobacteriia bacterium]|nr:UDP-N-acetylmuramate--L-alanine ligase [Coriobacteriia bacterium]